MTKSNICLEEKPIPLIFETKLISFSWLSKSMGDIDEDDGDKCKSHTVCCRNRILCDLCNERFVFNINIQRKETRKNQHEANNIHKVYYSTGQSEANSLHLANNYACNVTDGTVYQDSIIETDLR